MRQIHIPTAISPTPSPQEMLVAQIISEYFDSDITFIKRHNNTKTADIRFKNMAWEIKSPLGNGKRTMQNNLRSANSQSPNIIISLTQCKMHSNQAISRIKYELSKANTVKHLIVIKKDKKIIVLK